MAETRGPGGQDLGIAKNPLAEFPVAHRRDRVEVGDHVEVVEPVHQREGHARILAVRPAFPHGFRDFDRRACGN
ncbi:hypothetical protein ACN3XK_49250 [Actinomadura welshii]